MKQKKLEKVYRVVGPDGIGYYFSLGGELVRRVDSAVGYDTGSTSDHHPMPYQDGISEVPIGYIFGFEKIEHLKAWFTRDIMKAASDQSCEVQIWQVTKSYHLGNRQMCFCGEEAKKIESHPIRYFVK